MEKCITRWLRSGLGGLVVLLLVTTSGPARAYAVDSSILAILCNTELPEITISAPQSDSITDSSSLQIIGQALRTTQITITSNGDYDSTIVIDYQNPQFSKTVILQEGTNTIELLAHFSCNQTESTETIIITYQPASTPSPGDSVSTVANQAQLAFEQTNTSLTERLKGNLFPEKITDSTQTLEYRVDYVKPIRSWLALLASLFLLIIACLPRRFLFAILPLKTDYWSKKRVWFLRILLLLFMFLFAIIVQI